MRRNWIYRRGDIYYADLGVKDGSEQGGKRPVVLIQNNVGNRHSPTLTVVPVTSHPKKALQPTHFIFYPQFVLQGSSMVMAEQIMTIDKSKIVSYAGRLNEEQLNGVMEAVQIHLGLRKSLWME